MLPTQSDKEPYLPTIHQKSLKQTALKTEQTIFSIKVKHT